MEELAKKKVTATFPLNSKRLQLYQVQKIAGALDLLTTASGNDLFVMACGKLHENKCYPFMFK